MEDLSQFGEWSIDQKVFGWILSNIPVGSDVLELGSGWATGQLARYYKMHSVESAASFRNKYDSHYIFAPNAETGWYDINVLQEELTKIKYELLLVDGPEDCHKAKFMNHLNLFNMYAKIIIDDYQENHIKIMADKLSADLDRPGRILYGSKKMAMVIA